jgi:hypothetical protein
MNVIRIMTDSGKLAEKPEFIDFNLDGMKAANVSQYWMKIMRSALPKPKRSWLYFPTFAPKRECTPSSQIFVLRGGYVRGGQAD